MPLSITVAVCTYNRAAHLSSAIGSLLSQTLSPDAYEILVIDNASTDETPEIIQRYLDTPGRVMLRSAVQPILGLSHARNLAIEMAAGDIIAFIDDDAVADPGWLDALLETYARYPQAMVVGGRVLPLWEAPRPAWLTDDLLSKLSILDLGDIERPLNGREQVLGVNFSCKRRAFEEYGLFRTDLGRQGSSLFDSEETEFQRRLQDDGHPSMYNPQAVVSHCVSNERMQVGYFSRLAHDRGRTDIRRLMAAAMPGGRWVGRMIRGALRVVRWWLLRCLHPLDIRIRMQCIRSTAYWTGSIEETFVFGCRQVKTALGRIGSRSGS